MPSESYFLVGADGVLTMRAVGEGGLIVSRWWRNRCLVMFYPTFIKDDICLVLYGRVEGLYNWRLVQYRIAGVWMVPLYPAVSIIKGLTCQPSVRSLTSIGL